MVITGSGVAEGSAFGRAVVIRGAEESYPQWIPADAVESELEKMEAAFSQVTLNIAAAYDAAVEKAGEDAAEIYAVHAMLLEDPEFRQPILSQIRKGSSAQHAVDLYCSATAKRFAEMEDAYIRERAADFLDLRKQLLKALETSAAAPHELTEPGILVGEEILPSDLSNCRNATGIVMSKCGSASHVVILAKSMGIPVVTDVSADSIAEIPENSLLILDGHTGQIILEPDASQINTYRKAAALAEQRRALLQEYRGRPSETADGFRIDLCANITCAEDAGAATDAGADGVGLFRTEFLYMNRKTLPSEEEQFEAYRAVLSAFPGKYVIIRTLDIGADKKAEALALPSEENPAMGYRAIRICLKQEELFVCQIRALLRASTFGDLWIMLPMISGAEELLAAKALIGRERDALRARGVSVSDNIRVGIMIEVPSAALQAETLAAIADFFSIGTNDLTQYTLAVDRNNTAVAHLYQTAHPVVLRLIAATASAAKQAGIPCGMCGEAAGNEQLLPLWIGMGLTELSMSASSILPMRATLRGITVNACGALWESVRSQHLLADVQSELARFHSTVNTENRN